MGWEPFTERVIELISEKKENVAFMLWGSKARAKASLIDETRHLILEAAHPSPLTTGFLGCRHFSQANDYLQEHGRDPVDWYESIW
jgi:uracil-DNA glycosylase